MKKTNALSEELSYIVRSIMDTHTTKDYMSVLDKQYYEYIADTEIDNDFGRIHRFRTFVSTPLTDIPPCETPMEGIEEYADDFRHIITNIKAYRKLGKIIRADIKTQKSRTIRNMMLNFFNALMKGRSDISKHALLMDRYVGDVYPVGEFVRAIRSYGDLSGLIDYYYFKEKLDGY